VVPVRAVMRQRFVVRPAARFPGKIRIPGETLEVYGACCKMSEAAAPGPNLMKPRFHGAGAR